RKGHTDVDQPPKAWFKEALKDLLPDDVVNRPKRGFSLPVMEWHRALFAEHGSSLRDGYLVQHDVLAAESAQTLARGEFPSSAITPLSYKALVLEQWCRQMDQVSGRSSAY